MTPRVLLEHDRPRADGGEPRHVDRLLRYRGGYRIDWDVPVELRGMIHDLPRTVPGATYFNVTLYVASRLHGDAEAALIDWYTMPRPGERRVGRAPRGFEAARRKARERG